MFYPFPNLSQKKTPDSFPYSETTTGFTQSIVSREDIHRNDVISLPGLDLYGEGARGPSALPVSHDRDVVGQASAAMNQSPPNEVDDSLPVPCLLLETGKAA